MLCGTCGNAICKCPPSRLWLENERLKALLKEASGYVNTYPEQGADHMAILRVGQKTKVELSQRIDAALAPAAPDEQK